MAKKPKETRIIEQIPSTQEGLSAIASGNAPVIFFDHVANYGTYNGIAHMTLLVMRFLPAMDGQTGQDNAVAAHLRMNFAALRVLRDAANRLITQIEAPETASTASIN